MSSSGNYIFLCTQINYNANNNNNNNNNIIIMFGQHHQQAPFLQCNTWTKGIMYAVHKYQKMGPKKDTVMTNCKKKFRYSPLTQTWEEAAVTSTSRNS
jgi:hypothetical protein